MTKTRKIIYIVIAILILAALGFLGWKYLYNKDNQENGGYISTLYGKENKETLTEDVKAAYEKLLLNPSDVDSYMKVALWNRDQGKLNEAIKIYQLALQVRPQDTLLLGNVADLYTRNKQYEEAEQSYLKIIENNPKWVSSYRSLADLYRYNMPEKQNEIPKILQKGLDNNSENELYFVGPMAEYYKDFGPKEDAIIWYERLLKLDPKNGTAKLELEQLKNN